MIWLHKPSERQIQAFLESQNRLPFSYREVGWTRQALPSGYVVDHNWVQLGTGQAGFAQAKTAIQHWQMFNLGWVQLCWPQAPVAAGTTVAVLAHGFGFWSLNACRIVYVIDETVEEDGVAIERYGFAYGTLPDHVERGEERFVVEWRHADDSVRYDILAFSHPQQWLAKLGYPVVRQLQKRFARDSKRAMLRR